MMNCQECRDELAAYLEGLLDETCQNRMDAHLAECAACQTELHELRELTLRLACDGLDAPPISLETAVMDRILQEQALLIGRLKMRKRIRVLGMSGAMAAAAALLFIGGLWLAEPAEAQKAAEVMARGAEASTNPSTVHITAKVRTIPHDNFSLIGADYDLVPVEVWKQFGEKPKWRVEKPGRVAVMDGESTMMLIRPNYGVKFPKPSPSAFDSQWLLGLADVQNLLTRELTAGQAKGWEFKKSEETTESGKKQLVVSVEAKAGVADGDYSKNKWFDTSDMRRVYRFDAETQRLEGFEAHMHRPGGDVLVAVIERIEYNQPIAAEVFSLQLPKDVSWYKEPEQLADNAKYEKMTPKETAQAFFEACGKEDWKEAEKFFQPINEQIKGFLGGLEIVSLEEPFKSEKYPGWFVPYEIGLTMKVQLIVCSDNPAKRCIVFGIGMNPDEKQLAEIKKQLAELKPLADNEKYAKMTPQQAVQAFFTAYKEKDADEVQKLSGGLIPAKTIEQEMTGPPMAGFSVGEPAQAKEPGYWNVPVKIKIIRKHNLAVRNDNPAKRYIVDGGI